MSITVKTQDNVGKKVERLNGDIVKIVEVGARGYKVEGDRKQIPAKCLMMFDRMLRELDPTLEVDENDVRSTEKGYLQMKPNAATQYLNKPKGKTSGKKSDKKKVSKTDAMVERFVDEVNPKWLRENYETILDVLGVDIAGDGSTTGEYTEKSSKLRKLRISFLVNEVFEEKDLEEVLECFVNKDMDSFLEMYGEEESEDEDDEDIEDEDIEDEEDEEEDDDDLEGDLDLDDLSLKQLIKIAVEDRIVKAKIARKMTEADLRAAILDFYSDDEEEQDEDDDEDQTEDDEEEQDDSEAYEDEAEEEQDEDETELADIEGNGFIPEFVYPQHPRIIIDPETNTAELDLSDFTEADTDSRVKGNKYKELVDVLNVVHGMSSTALRSMFTKMFENVSDIKVQVSNTMQDGKRGVRFDVGVLFDAPAVQSSLISDEALSKISEKVTESEKFANLVNKYLEFDWSQARNTQLTDEQLSDHYILVGGTAPKDGKVRPVLQVVGGGIKVLKNARQLENFLQVEEFDYYCGKKLNVRAMTRRQIIEYLQSQLRLTAQELEDFQELDINDLGVEADKLLDRIFKTDSDEDDIFGSVGGDVDEDEFDELDEDFEDDEEEDDEENEDEDLDDDLLDDEEDEDEDLDDDLADFDEDEEL